MDTILIVEDEPEILEVMLMAFRLEGFLPVPASSALEALKLLGGLKPDLILSDLRMPRVSGAELCHAVRAHPDFGHIPIVLVSALPQQLAAEEFECYDAFLRKPFALDDLIATVRRLLAEPKQKRVQSPKSPKFGGESLTFLALRR